MTFIGDPVKAGKALRGWLATKVDDPAAEVLDVRLPAEGSSGGTLLLRARWSSDGRQHEERLVCRVQADRYPLFPDLDVIGEAAIMAELGRRGGVPVPRVLWTEPDTAQLGEPFVVTAFVHGKSPPNVPSYHETGWVVELSLDARSLLHENALRALAAVHATPWGELGFLLDESVAGTGLDKYLDYVARWHHWTAAGRPLGAIDGALEILLRDRPDDQTLCLVWGDARPGNMLFGPDLSVAAVLDWEMATIGPPEIDLGWWLMYEDFQTAAAGVERLSGVPTRAETVARYEALAGRSVRDLDYYVLLANHAFALIAARQIAIQVELGKLAPATTMHIGNPIVQMLARRLDLPVPPVAPEFAAMMAARTNSTRRP